MKSFRVKFIGGLLILAIFTLTCGLYGVYKFAKLVAGIYPMFMNMQYPMMLLCQAMVLGLILALVFGLLALKNYGEDKVFERKTLLDLQVVTLSFIGIFLLSILAILYTNFNLQGSITNLIFIGTGLVSMLVGQIFLLLCDMVKEGIDLKEENDLTI